MDGTEAVADNRGTVLCRPISLVTGKSVYRVQAVLLSHDPITCHFGEYRGGSDGMAPRIPVDNGGERYIVPCEPVPINQEMTRSYGQSGNGNVHGFERGLENVQGINVLFTNNAYAGGYRTFLDLRKQLFTPVRREFFRIIDTIHKASHGEDDGSGNNRTGKRPSTGLIDAGNPPHPRLPNSPLKFERDFRIH
jgi:hypothetical protein